MQVEYFRLWGENGDSGTWDTDYVEVPDDTSAEDMEKAIYEACQKLKWKDGNAPVIVGFYANADAYLSEDFAEEEN